MILIYVKMLSVQTYVRRFVMTAFVTALPWGATGVKRKITAPLHCSASFCPYHTSTKAPHCCPLHRVGCVSFKGTIHRFSSGSSAAQRCSEVCLHIAPPGVTRSCFSSTAFGSLTPTAPPLCCSFLFCRTEPNMCQAAGNWVAITIPPALPAPL